MSDLKVDLHVADAAFQGAVDAGLLYSEDAAKAGITLNIVREPNDGYWSNVWLVKPFCACYWGGRPTEDWMFSTAYAKGAPWNDTHWANEGFNELLVQARAELDNDKRRDMYHEMQALCRDDGGTVVPMFSKLRHGHERECRVRRHGSELGYGRPQVHRALVVCLLSRKLRREGDGFLPISAGASRAPCQPLRLALSLCMHRSLAGGA